MPSGILCHFCGAEFCEVTLAALVFVKVQANQILCNSILSLASFRCSIERVFEDLTRTNMQDHRLEVGLSGHLFHFPPLWKTQAILILLQVSKGQQALS